MPSTTGPPPTLYAKLVNRGIIQHALRGIANGKRDQHVEVCFSETDGIRVLATDSTKSLQGCVCLPPTMFDVWQVDGGGSREEDDDDDDEEDRGRKSSSFRVNLAVFLDCLSLLGAPSFPSTGGSNFGPPGTTTMGSAMMESNASLTIAYYPDEAVVRLHFVEGDFSTECKIRTLVTDLESGVSTVPGDGDGDYIHHDDGEEDLLDFASAFRAAASVNKLIVASKKLRDAFTELSDLPGASTIGILTSSRAPYLRLSTRGDGGFCEVDFHQGEESFNLFECASDLYFEYRLSLLQLALKSLGDAEKTFVRVNSDGILSVQHLLSHHDGTKIYVDFFVLSDATTTTANGEEEDDQQQQQVVESTYSTARR